MMRFGEESRACNNDGSYVNASQNNIRSLEEVRYPRLNLPLTKTPELLKEIESILQQQYNCNVTYHENHKTREKQKAMNFPISKITIGEWTREAVYQDDLKAKFYFAKKKLMWETLDRDETETPKMSVRLKRKIEIQWSDVLSLKPWYHSTDETGFLKVELRKPPTFFIETNPQPGKHTQWQQVDQDFTLNQSASCNRIHTLHFAPGVLQKNMDKLVSGDSFWSELVKVIFPSSKDLYFKIDYGNSNNNNNIINSSRCSGQTLSFNVNNDLHYHSQGVCRTTVAEVNFNFCSNYGRQTNSYVQGNIENNTVNQLPVTQVSQPPSQPINEQYNRGGCFPESEFYNSMFQDINQMQNTAELFESQAFGHGLLETQTNWMMFPHTKQFSMYPQVPHDGYLAQEGERQNMEHTHLDDNFLFNGNQQIDFNQFDGCDFYQTKTAT